MNSGRVYRTEAVVLKGFDFGEADRILTLYTPDVGKLRVIAKGIRRTKSRKAGHLDLFMRSSLLVARGRQLDIVTQAETIENFQGMRTDLTRSTYCHYVAELVDGFTGENLANQPLYELTVKTFRRLAEDMNLHLVVRSFELQLLGLTGYRPQLRRCLACDATIEPEANRFSSKLGGVLCPGCGSADVSAPSISVPALKLMRNLQLNDELALAPGDVRPEVYLEVERQLQPYIEYRLEARPRSTRIIEQMRVEQLTT